MKDGHQGELFEQLIFDGERFEQKLSEELSKLDPELVKQDETTRTQLSDQRPAFLQQRGCSFSTVGAESRAVPQETRRAGGEGEGQKRPLQAGDKEKEKAFLEMGALHSGNENPPNLLPPPHGLFLPSCRLSAESKNLSISASSRKNSSFKNLFGGNQNELLPFLALKGFDQM